MDPALPRPTALAPFFRAALCLPAALIACGQAPVSQSIPSAACPPNQCQLAGMLQDDGTCRYTPRADGTSCDDNNSCTLYDTCRQGVCVGGTVLKDGTRCDDRNVCTQTDLCQSGVCVGTNPLVCPEADACNEGGICDPIKGCVLKSYGPCVEGLSAATLTGCVQSAYTTPLNVGGNPFSMLVDSGSTTLGLAAASCQNCLTAPLYTPGASAVDASKTATASYSDGTGWRGKIYQETVFVGSTTAPLTPAARMRLVAISQEANPNAPFFVPSTCSGTSVPNAYQGILGLGPSDLALDATDGFLDAVAKRSSATYTYDAFALSLCDVDGRMWYGGFNPAAATRAPDFTPMVTKGVAGSYYAVALDDILVGATSLGLSADTLGPVVLDSGAPLWAMSPTAYQALTQLIATNTAFVAHFAPTFFSDGNCVASSQGATAAELDAALPPLTLTMPSGGTVGGMQVTLKATASYLLPQMLDGQTLYCSTLTRTTGPAVMGSALLRSQVVIFDRGKAQIGFAPSTGCSNALPSVPPEARN